MGPSRHGKRPVILNVYREKRDMYVFGVRNINLWQMSIPVPFDSLFQKVKCVQILKQ